MISLDDIAALPHGEGKAVALTLWNRLQIVYRAFADSVESESRPRSETLDEVVIRLESEHDK